MESDVTFEAAVRAAEEIEVRIKQEGLPPAFAEFEKALQQFSSAGYPIDAIIPAGTEPQLGFSLARTSDGKSFWKVYAEVACEELCKPDGELQRLVKSGLSGSTGALLTAVMTGLGLPAAALAIAIPIAGILAAKGIDTFCRFRADEGHGD